MKGGVYRMLTDHRPGKQPESGLPVSFGSAFVALHGDQLLYVPQRQGGDLV